MADDISVLGIEVESRGVKEGADALDKLADSGKNAEQSTTGLTGSTKKASYEISALAKAAVAAGAAFSVGAFATMVRSVADAGDQLSKLSSKTNIAVDDLSKLQYAASLSDLSNDGLSASLARLNRMMGDAADGSKEATAALARFGIKPDMGTLEAFQQIAERVKNTADATRTANALNDVFGRGYAELIPLLKGGADGLKKSGDELERMGGVMSGDLARASEEFNDNLTRINKSLEALRIETMAPVISGLESLTSKFVEATKAAGGFWKGLATWGMTSGNQEADPGKAIVELVKKLAVLKEQKEGLEKSNYFGIYNKDDLAINSKQIETVTRQLEYLKSLNTRSAGDYSDRWMSGTTSAPGITDAPSKTKKTRAKWDDPLGDFIEDMQPKIRTYESMMQSFEKMNLDAQASTAGLTDAEKKYLEVTNSSEWASLGEGMQERVRAMFESANETERAANETERLNKLLGETTTEKWKAFASDVEFLQKALEGGRIEVEQYEEAIRALSDKNTSKLNEQKDVAKELGMTFSSAFEDAIVEGKKFSDVLDGLYKDILRILARKNITEPLASAFSSFNWGSLFSANALGGVYSSPGLSAYSGTIVDKPTVFPFANGIGLMGEKGAEAILPLKRGQNGILGVSSSMPNISVTINNTMSDQAEVSAKPRMNNGQVELEVIVQRVMASDARRNGPITQGMAQTFGIQRSAF